MASTLITKLAESEGVDLSLLRLPRTKRRSGRAAASCNAARVVNLSGIIQPPFLTAEDAFHFVERYELEGLVARDWSDPKGRLGFGLDGSAIHVEMHWPEHGVLVQASPERLVLTLAERLPIDYLFGIRGCRLDAVVAWRLAEGPDYLVGHAEQPPDGLPRLEVDTVPVIVP